MPAVAAFTLLALVSSVTMAADKDADKAEEAALALLKALKAKDIDAVMKTVDTPFEFDFGSPPCRGRRRRGSSRRTRWPVGSNGRSRSSGAASPACPKS